MANEASNVELAIVNLIPNSLILLFKIVQHTANSKAELLFTLKNTKLKQQFDLIHGLNKMEQNDWLLQLVPLFWSSYCRRVLHLYALIIDHFVLLLLPTSIQYSILIKYKSKWKADQKAKVNFNAQYFG